MLSHAFATWISVQSRTMQQLLNSLKLPSIEAWFFLTEGMHHCMNETNNISCNQCSQVWNTVDTVDSPTVNLFVRSVMDIFLQSFMRVKRSWSLVFKHFTFHPLVYAILNLEHESYKSSKVLYRWQACVVIDVFHCFWPACTKSSHFGIQVPSIDAPLRLAVGSSPRA